MVPSFPLLSCESSVSVKENPDKKKATTTTTLRLNNLKTVIFVEAINTYYFIISVTVALN